MSELIVYMYVMVCVPPLSLCSSYLHCRWADLEELEKDKRIHQKVKRFRAKQALPTFVTEVSPTVLSSLGVFLSVFPHQAIHSLLW